MTDGMARSLGRLGAAVRIGTRMLLPIDTNPVPRSWDHVTKVDPEAEKRLPLTYPLYLRHTDAVSVGGSREVTPANTQATFELLEYAPTPCFQEPSAPEHVSDASQEHAEFLAIPEVLNGDVESLIGTLGAGIEHVRSELAPKLVEKKAPFVPEFLKDRIADAAASWLLEEAVFEAYIIQNPDSAAAREAGVTEDDLLDPDEARRRAMAAERRLGSEVLYLEYSGTYGGEEAEAILSAVDEGLNWARTWYGGGISSREDAERMLAAGADAVVVGDAFHEVAEEETDVCSAALDELGADASQREIAEWVESRFDPDTSAGAGYLSTIPHVDDPEERALEYLTVAVRAYLGIESIVAEGGADTAQAVRDRIGDVDGLSAFDELGDDGRAYARASTEALLGRRLGVATDEFHVDHLGIAGRADGPAAASDD